MTTTRHRQLPADAETWVQLTFSGLTLEEKIGQLVMVSCYGGFASVESDEFRRLARQVKDNSVGGLVIATRRGALGIERSHAYPTAALVNALQERARIPLLVGADFERGTAMRLQEGTSFPEAMAVAAAGRPDDAYTMGRITALEGRAVGVPWIFAPVADVNNNSGNPIINIRSFGENPERVSEFITAFIRGVEENGGLSTAKHFPGHGDTDLDSHLGLPTIHCDRARLEHLELVPFRAAISAGVSAVMTGHLAVPALEPDANVPATLSGTITTETLRREMRFEGLVVTDDLDMGGVTERYSPGEIAVRSILAGSDLLLSPPDPDAALAALREAASSGRLPLARIDDAVKQILRAKARLSLHRGSRASLDALAANFARPEYSRAAQDIADRGITLLRDSQRILPLDATKSMRVLLVAVAGNPDRVPAETFENELRRHIDTVQTVRCDTSYATVDRLNIPTADAYDALVVALSARFADRKGSVGLQSDQIAAVHKVLESKKPIVVCCFGSPYTIESFPEALTWLAALSVTDVAQRAAARAIVGEVAIGGKIPVSVPGAVAAGAGIAVAADPMTLAPSVKMNAQLAPAHALLDRARDEGAFPGGVLAVGFHGQLSIRAFGKLSNDADAAPVGPETIYDTASLTKAVVTATLAAMLTEPERLDLDAPVARYLPEWNAGPKPEWRAQVTVRHLLTHSSGLPNHRDYFRSNQSKRDLLAAAMMESLTDEPGAQSVYSDIGFILLGEILERLTGLPLDRAAQERIFAPLGMTKSMFNPGKDIRADIAPTEFDAELRGRLAQGEVHDENCWAMGGVTGHAGMFSTAADLACFCQMMLNGGIYAHRRLLKRATVEQFTTADPLSGNTRTLGWNVPTPDSSSGRYFSPRSFGHTGFTGTSVWIDPERQLFVVLLTNRVNPSRHNDKIQRVRPAVHDAVVEALRIEHLTAPMTEIR